ncbi:hypothetical protein LXL04_021559 [Taraxacum kok-saghyz]
MYFGLLHLCFRSSCSAGEYLIFFPSLLFCLFAFVLLIFKFLLLSTLSQLLKVIAGAYSENVPVICIVGGPNFNDYGTNRILHHTIGLPDFRQELRCFQTVTYYQAVVNISEDAKELTDTTISTALKESKPVYISVGCNLPAIPHPTFSREPVPFSLPPSTFHKSPSNLKTSFHPECFCCRYPITKHEELVWLKISTMLPIEKSSSMKDWNTLDCVGWI